MVQTEWDDRELQNRLLDTCLDVIYLKSDPKDAVARIIDLAEHISLIPSLILDVLLAADTNLDEINSDTKEESTNKFLEFLKGIENVVVPEDVLQMELKTLHGDDRTQLTSMVRMRTRIYFKQLKFNMLREESEGYSKLVTELIDSGSHLSSKALNTRILSLIGQFNLDPNRVCDIVLECFECAPTDASVFVPLLKEMKVNTEYLCSILGFKYAFYHKPNSVTPFSLYQVTAALVHANLVDLMTICTFMIPSGDQMKILCKEIFDNNKKRAKSAESISTAHISIESKQNVFPEGQEPMNIVGVSFATVTAIQDDDDLKLTEGKDQKTLLGSNQKLGLLCALVEFGDWSHAKEIIDRMPAFFGASSINRISLAVADIVDSLIDSFYRSKCAARSLRNGVFATKSIIDENLKQVSSWTELSDLASILLYLGPRLAYRPNTFTKFVRLVTEVFRLKEKGDEECQQVSNSIMDLVGEIIIPGLTLSDGNCALSEEVWTLISYFHYTQRYRLYGRWKGSHTLRHSEMSIQKGKVIGRTKYVLKRLSKETVRLMGRQLGKLCHVHPAVVFDYLLSQVQTFDNLIQPVVESIKFLTNLEFDVLSFCIMEQLASPEKQQLKASDGSISPWMQSLATLVGAVFKKYNIELTGMLHYVGNQLKNGKSFDLLVLREIVSNMGAVEVGVGQTPEQLQANSGGDLLRQEGGSFANARNKRSCSRLKEAVLKDDLAIGLAILMAQQRQCVVFKDSSDFPLKLAGEMVDQCRDTMMQFGSFLLSNVRTEEYCRMIPPIEQLIMEFHLPYDAAMYLVRPTFMPQVNANYYAAKKALKASTETEEGKDKDKMKLDTILKNSFYKEAFDVALKKISQAIEPLLTGLANEVPARTFALFWLLSQYDLECPEKAYEREIEKIRKNLDELMSKPELSKTKRAKEEERLRSLEGKLADEMRKQKEHVTSIRAWISIEKDNFFGIDLKMQQIPAFIQTCVLPRAMMSEADAIYTARFIHHLHVVKTPAFATVLLLDKLFNDPLPYLVGLTENEVVGFGRLLQLMMHLSICWHGDKKAFDNECTGFPGFFTKIRTQASEEETEKQIDYPKFKKLVFKWQLRLSKTFASILSIEDADYVLIRNTLVMMTQLLPCYPILRYIKDELVTVVEKLRDREKGQRDDLSLKAASYVTHLKMRKIQLWETNEFANGMTEMTILPHSSVPVISERKRQATTDTNGDVETKVRRVASTEKSDKSEKTERREDKKEERIRTPRSLKKEKRVIAVKEEVIDDKQDEREEGEVPPSPPHKKMRSVTKASDEKEKYVKPSDVKVEKSDRDKKSDSSNGIVKKEKTEVTEKETKRDERPPKEKHDKEKDHKREKESTDKESTPKERERIRVAAPVENERIDKKERRTRTGTEKMDRKDRHKDEADNDKSNIGPMLPPTKLSREDRKSKERDGKDKEKRHRRAKEDDENGDVKIPSRKERDTRDEEKKDKGSPKPVRERIHFSSSPDRKGDRRAKGGRKEKDKSRK